MIPAAYFFVKEKIERLDNYSSTLSEYFTHKEALQEDKKGLKYLSYATSIVDVYFQFEYVYVVYNLTDQKKLFATIGESTTPKMLIDSKKKEEELNHYYNIFTELRFLLSDVYQSKYFDFDDLYGDKKEKYKDDIDIFNNSVDESIGKVENLLESCWSDFKKEFMF